MMNPHETVWIIGGKGRIGKALTKVLNPMDYRLIITDKSDVDITKLSEVMSFVERNVPYAIINCGAMTNARQCEEQADLAFQTNALGARNVAIAAESQGSKLVHLSTDDIFSGKKDKLYNEFHEGDSTSTYGITKHVGEEFVKEMTNRFFIIRSSWVYDKKTLLKIKQGIREGALLFAMDQVASPTSALALAKFIAKLIDTYEFGVYHYTCEGTCTRHEFIREAAYLMGMGDAFEKTELHQLKTSIHPDYIALDCLMLRMLQWERPLFWKDELKNTIETYFPVGGVDHR